MNKKFLWICILYLVVIAFSVCSPQARVFADGEYLKIVLDDNFLVVRGDWEVSEDGAVSQVDTISSSTSYKRMLAYKDAYKNVTIEFEMLYIAASSSEAWCGVAFNKAMATDSMELSGYLVALKDYGRLQLYNWNKTQVLGDVDVVGENASNNGDTHQWRSYKIICEGENILIYVDGQKLIDVTDSTYSQGYISLNAGDSTCSFRNIKIDGEVVKMTVYTQPSDGDISQEELERRNKHFNENKNEGKEVDVGSSLSRGSIGKIIKNYLEDTFIDVGNKTPKSYLQLFVIGIIVAVLFVGASAFLIIKTIKAGKRR